MSEANLLKFPVVFATVFTQEIFSNFCRNALKSPNISAERGDSPGVGVSSDADIFTSLIICLQIWLLGCQVINFHRGSCCGAAAVRGINMIPILYLC